MSSYKAQYLWLDGTTPAPQIRGKTKILSMGEAPPIWGFDGSSTNQAEGSASDCVLNPVFVCPDPIRGGDHKIVLCEVLLPDMTPHPSNTRAACVATAEKFANHQSLFGIEQEYTFFVGQTPLGWPEEGYPGPQGPYYCAVGPDNVYGRDIVEAHLDACLHAGLRIGGVNAEVMPAQWEYQIGPIGTVEVSDELWVARWLLERIAEDFGVRVSLDAKPVKGDWNGAGGHTNYSTAAMRESYEPIIRGIQALGEKAELHIANYGAGIDERLTGLHETCSYKDFRYGVSDRGASVRIPWQVARDQRGYLEDRRPNANCDPYTVTRLIVDTICGATI
jgi:glutamine synthetase